MLEAREEDEREETMVGDALDARVGTRIRGLVGWRTRAMRRDDGTTDAR